MKQTILDDDNPNSAALMWGGGLFSGFSDSQLRVIYQSMCMQGYCQGEKERESCTVHT